MHQGPLFLGTRTLPLEIVLAAQWYRSAGPGVLRFGGLTSFNDISDALPRFRD